MNLTKEAEQLKEQIIRDRRHLHQHPEVGMELPETVAYVRGRLEAMGYEVNACGDGLVAVIGSGSPCLLLRADMDALKVQEENDLPFCAKNGYGHMCGHDMHTAILLGAAQLLMNHADALKGTVKLMFQTGEETMHGAESMLNAGVLEAPHVDAALGLHVMTPLDNGALIYKTGPAFSGAELFRIDVAGKGGHGSMLESTHDPIHALVQVYNLLESIVPREVSMFDAVACSVGRIEGGSMCNVIPNTAALEGSLRSFNNAARDRVLARMEAICQGVAAATETTITLSHEGVPPLVNDALLCGEMAPFLKEIGGLRVMEVETPINGSEDFAFVSEKVPTMFLLLGVGGKDEPSNHNPNCIFAEDYIHLASAALANAAIGWLASRQ